MTADGDHDFDELLKRLRTEGEQTVVLAGMLTTVMDRLDDRQQRILDLAVQGTRLAAIAQQLGCTLSEVRQALQMTEDLLDEVQSQPVSSRFVETVVLSPVGDSGPLTQPEGDKTVPAKPPVGPESWPRIPGYDIRSELGRGSMGVVYRAVQKSSGRVLALKVIRPVVATEQERLRMFVREASILSQLEHPHIIRFVGMGTVQDEFFVATEYVDVVPLHEILNDKPLKYRIKVICGIACHVLEALKYAHDSGLVHRDIKPSNILLSRERHKLNAKLADFGLAKNYEDAGLSGMTADGDLRGSLIYMAPEQIRNARDAKPPCDLYSLGVTLYQMLSGKFPFERHRGFRLMCAILEEPQVPLQERCPEIPDELAALIHRALAKDPADRFASAKEMHRAFYPFRRGKMA